MKKKLLIILLCTLCVTAFAQRRPTTTAKQRAAAAAKLKAANAAKLKAANSTAKNTPVQQPSVTDTTNKKQASLQAKPFDRPLDGYFKKSNILAAKVTPYAPLREADIVFQKRVWEEFDLREKTNTYMASPKARLIDIFMSAIETGELTAYDPIPSKDDPDGDAFSKPLKPGEAKNKLADSSLVNKTDTAGNIVSTSRVAGEFNPDSIVRYRIKEDWMFDKQRSVYEVRIIGIAPLIKPKIAAGIDADLQPAFWIYFPEARQVLATKEAINRDNDATGLSYDDVFMKRLFSAYVVKQSNNKDERIKDYKEGIDRLYESQRIKKALMDWELDLWQY
jgi:gliding motility associated protien GldN